MSIHFMIDHCIDNTASQINDAAKFILHLLIGMFYFKNTFCIFRFHTLVQYISFVCRYHIIPSRTNQCNVLNNNLTADTIQRSQLCSRQWNMIFLHPTDNCLSSFSSCHATQFLLRPFTSLSLKSIILHKCNRCSYNFFLLYFILKFVYTNDRRDERC